MYPSFFQFHFFSRRFWEKGKYLSFFPGVLYGDPEIFSPSECLGSLPVRIDMSNRGRCWCQSLGRREESQCCGDLKVGGREPLYEVLLTGLEAFVSFSSYFFEEEISLFTFSTFAGCHVWTFCVLLDLVCCTCSCYFSWASRSMVGRWFQVRDQR